MNDPDDNPLAGVDLHRWRVPPPPAGQHAAILGRALAPGTPPRRRIGWAIPAAILASAVIAAAIALVVGRPAPAPAAPSEPIAVRPAGGPSSEVRELLLRLERQELQLELQIDEIRQLRELAKRLEDKIAKLEARDSVDRRDRPPVPPKVPTPAPTPSPDPACDEVSCVLTNYEGACCARYVRSGTLRLNAKPPARIIVDGKDTGKSTPATLSLLRGRHQVTLVIGATRQTFAVTIEAGHTTNIIKDYSDSAPF